MFKKYMVVMAIIIAMGVSAFGTNWNGLVGGDNWTVPSNWDTGVVPTDPCDVVFYTGLTLYGVVDTPVGSINSLLISHFLVGDGRLDINTGGSLSTISTSVIGMGDKRGDLNINGGTLNFGTHVYVGQPNGYDPNIGSGNITVTGGNLNVGGTMALGRSKGASRLSISGGTVDIANELYMANQIGDNSGCTAYLDMTGGSLTTHGYGFLVSTTAGSTGVVTMSGGTITTMGDSFWICLSGNGAFDMTGGTLNSKYLFLRNAGSALFNAHGGTVNISGNLVLSDPNYFAEGETCILDVTKGTIIISGDKVGLINTGVSWGQITAYGDDPRAKVNVDYSITNAGKTTVTATGFDPNLAWGPYPSDGAANAPKNVTCTWKLGDTARATAAHYVYFGDSNSVVFNSTTPVSTPTQPQDANSYTPSGLQYGQTYYWRIDEVDTVGVIHKGKVWAFTVKISDMIDDFESYNGGKLITDSWVANSGASVSVGTSPSPVLGAQSMMLTYNDAGSPFYSEAAYTLGSENWTEVKALSVAFIGSAGNAIEKMYVTIEDTAGQKSTIFYGGDPNLVKLGESWQTTWWNSWNIDVTQLGSVNRTAIKKISIGMGNKTSPAAGGGGTMYFDNLQKYYTSRCVAEKATGDMTGDCMVDVNDLAVLSPRWLSGSTSVTGIAPPTGPRVWYTFDATSGTTVTDSSGYSKTGGIVGAGFTWEPAGGHVGGCLNFSGTNAYIISQPSIFDTVSNAMTITTWIYGTSATPIANTYLFAVFAPSMSNIFVAAPAPAGNVYYAANGDGISWNRDINNRPVSSDWYGQWRHYAFVKDVTTGTMKMYEDGILVSHVTGTTATLSGINVASGNYSPRFAIGAYVTRQSGVDNVESAYYKGKLDDFRIYNYALSQENIAYLVQGTTPVTQPLYDRTADLNRDGSVNLRDLAVMATKWMSSVIWP